MTTRRTSSTRRRNVALVLGHILRNGPRSRSDLVAETGLTKAAVASLVNGLVESGLLVELDVTHTGQTGRPSRPVDVAAGGIEGIGVEIGNERVAGMTTDLSGSVVAELDGPFETAGPDVTDASPDAVIAAATAVLAGLIDSAAGRGAVMGGVCVAVPARLHRDAAPPTGGPAALLPRLFGALSDLASRRGRPGARLVVERTGALAAVAEHRLGGVARGSSLVVVDGGVAIEGGTVIDGEPLRGAGGLVADLGHLVIDPGGTRCPCGGRGCWETVIGVEAILRECAPDLAANPRALRSSRVLDAVAGRAGAGDPVAVEGLSSVGRWLGTGLASVVAVLDPDAVVLDGSFRQLSPWLLDPAVDALATQARGRAGEAGFVAVSALEGTAARRGAAIRAAEQVLGDPLAVLGAGRPEERPESTAAD